MKKSHQRAFAKMSLEDEGSYWEEEEYDDFDGGENAAPQKPNGEVAVASTPDEYGQVCAVCLSAILPEDLAIVKGCEHEYCVNCILQWATCKEVPWCPQCKNPFNYLYCHRLLDGTLSDVPVEESVCLLKRAAWFVEHVKTLEKGKAVSAAMADADIPPEWGDPYQYDDEDDDYDEDEQIEKYYFSSAAGRARVVLGNRRLGENGYMRAGRMYARPSNNNSSINSQPSGSDSIGKAGKSRTPVAKAAPSSRSGAGNAGGGGGSSSDTAGPSGSAAAAGPGPGPSQEAKGQGRRAKRNARRAAADLEF